MLLRSTSHPSSLPESELRADSAPVNNHFASIGRGFRGERKGVCDIKRAPGGLVEDLVDLDIHRGARCIKPAFDRLERKMNLRLFKPGCETEGGSGCAL